MPRALVAVELPVLVVVEGVKHALDCLGTIWNLERGTTWSGGQIHLRRWRCVETRVYVQAFVEVKVQVEVLVELCVGVGIGSGADAGSCRCRAAGVGGCACRWR